MIPAEMPVFGHETVAGLLSLGILPRELSELRSLACENANRAKELEKAGCGALLAHLRERMREREAFAFENPN